MPIRVPPDARVITDNRLTAIRVISTLNDRLIGGDAGLKAKVKAAMQSKKADYAESDLVIAALRPGNSQGPVDPEKLYALVGNKAGQLTREQFLECVTINKTALKKHLGEEAIAALCPVIKSPEPSLIPEFKPHVDFEVEHLDDALANLIKHATRIKAA